ncbi:DUF3892 domain-containing protein [Amycolatopsis magusensis]|uniref:DUF3892 domain-containing protein n=1 Tax=Amycolatopsis magusensis TaxID=882444 RepID=UPI003C2F5829
MSIRITSVHLEGGTLHEHIARLRWKNRENGETGESTRSAIVTWIETKKGTAYVSEGGHLVHVGVVTPTHGPKHLRTYADKTWTNNLLSLPRF